MGKDNALTDQKLKAKAKEIGGFLSKVAAARELQKELAMDLYKEYKALAHEARAAGNYEVAEAIIWKLLEHMPADEDGKRVVDISVDKPKQVDQKGGPTIQIGFQLGGMSPQKELSPANVIDGEVKKDDE